MKKFFVENPPSINKFVDGPGSKTLGKYTHTHPPHHTVDARRRAHRHSSSPTMRMSVLLGNLADFEQEEDEEEEMLAAQREEEIRRKQQLEEEDRKRRKAAALQSALLGGGVMNMEDNLKDMEEVHTSSSHQVSISDVNLCVGNYGR